MQPEGGNTIGGVSFTDVDNSNNSNIIAAITEAGVRPVGVSSIPATIPLQSGDEVEYTVYFADPGADLNNARLCDLIPAGTTYSNNSISVNQSRKRCRSRKLLLSLITITSK